MNIFDTLIVQPIFNLLAGIYGLIPGSDFGIALIIFTVLVRFAMWPLVKKQLHQTKIQRQLQPELKKIKEKAKGNKQLEGQMMLDLYKEKGVNPMGTIGILFLQLPIYIALFSVINIITKRRDRIADFAYSPIEQLGPIHDIIHSTNHYFNESLLGLVNLARPAIEAGAIYWPALVLAALTAVLQYYQTKQITPQPTEKKKLSELFAETAAGKDVDQSEVSAIMANNMNKFFPFLTFIIMVYLPSAIALYAVVSSVVALFQQKAALQEDVKDMEILANTSSDKKAKQREVAAVEAVVVPRVKKPRGKKRSKRKDS